MNRRSRSLSEASVHTHPMKQQRGGETAFAKRARWFYEAVRWAYSRESFFLGLFEREISVRGYKKWLNLKTKSLLRASDARRHSREGLEFLILEKDKNLNANANPNSQILLWCLHCKVMTQMPSLGGSNTACTYNRLDANKANSY